MDPATIALVVVAAQYLGLISQAGNALITVDKLIMATVDLRGAFAPPPPPKKLKVILVRKKVAKS